MLITFMSDFGTRDGYTGAVKGVLKSLAPSAEIIDITHHIPAYDINKAAFTLATYYRTFPAGTVHLCVIDPGVGSERAGIIAVTDSYFFVGPDNGLFDLVFRQMPVELYEIPLPEDADISAVFHGRDVFAPVAAHLANGVDAQELGKKIEAGTRIFPPVYQRKGSVLLVPPLTSDHFGNIVFGIAKEDLKNFRIVKLQFKDFTFDGIQQFYQQAKEEQLLCLWNSMELLEIAVNRGNALAYTQADLVQDKLRITVETL